jgi:hypothetical protein
MKDVSTLPGSVDYQARSQTMRETSQRTWENVRDEIGGPARQATYEMLIRVYYHYGPPTSSEVARFAGPSVGKCPWKRMSELVQMEVVKETAERECAVTGQTVLTYTPVETFPVPRPLPKNEAPDTPTAEEFQSFLDEMGIVYDWCRRTIPPGPPPSEIALKVEAWLEYRIRHDEP